MAATKSKSYGAKAVSYDAKTSYDATAASYGYENTGHDSSDDGERDFLGGFDSSDDERKNEVDKTKLPQGFSFFSKDKKSMNEWASLLKPLEQEFKENFDVRVVKIRKDFLMQDQHQEHKKIDGIAGIFDN